MQFEFILLGSLLVALLATFVLKVFGKWHVLDYYEFIQKKYRWLPKPCTLCFAFWAGWLAVMFYTLIFGFTWVLLFWPFCVPPLVLYIYKR